MFCDTFKVKCLACSVLSETEERESGNVLLCLQQFWIEIPAKLLGLHDYGQNDNPDYFDQH